MCAAVGFAVRSRYNAVFERRGTAVWAARAHPVALRAMMFHWADEWRRSGIRGGLRIEDGLARFAERLRFAGEPVAHHFSCTLVDVAGFEPHPGLFTSKRAHSFECRLSRKIADDACPCDDVRVADGSVIDGGNQGEHVDDVVSVHNSSSNGGWCLSAWIWATRRSAVEPALFWSRGRLSWAALRIQFRQVPTHEHFAALDPVWSVQ